MINNIFDHIPATLPNELTETLLKNQSVRIERIISCGHSTPPEEWYDQDKDEWVALLSGSAHIEFEADNSLHPLKPGDYLLIPAHCRHRVAWTAPDCTTVWLAIHLTQPPYNHNNPTS